MFFGTGVLSIGAFCYFYFTSLQYCPLSVSAILLYTSPVFIMLFSALLFHERIGPRKILAMLLALAGCGLVSGLMDGFGAVPVYGVVTGLLSGFTYAMYSIFARVALKKYHTLTMATLPLGGAEVTIRGLMGSRVALLVGIVGSLLCSATPFFLYTKGMETLDTGKAGILATTEPVMSAVVSVAILKEPMGIWGAVGIGLVLAAIVLLAKNQTEEKEKAPLK